MVKIIKQDQIKQQKKGNLNNVSFLKAQGFVSVQRNSILRYPICLHFKCEYIAQTKKEQIVGRYVKLPLLPVNNGKFSGACQVDGSLYPVTQ